MSVEKIYDQNADLNNYVNNPRPKDDVHTAHVIGDLHANAWLMWYFFQREGIATLNEGLFYQLKNIYHTIWFDEDATQIIVENPEAVLNKYQNILANIEFNQKKTVHFVGDTTADRSCYGDQYILFNYEILDQKHIKFDICLANHDLEFIIAYWKGKKKNLAGDLSAIASSNVQPVISTHVTDSLIKKGVIEKEKISALVENHYFPHINLFSYEITADGIVLITHAPVDFELIKLAAHELGVNYRDETPQALGRTIDTINDRFNKMYIQTGDICEFVDDERDNAYKSIKTGLTSKRIALQSTELLRRMRFIVAALTWNVPKLKLNRPSSHSNYSVHYAHGHTYTLPVNDSPHIYNLDSLFGKSENTYKIGGQITAMQQMLDSGKYPLHTSIGKGYCSVAAQPLIIPQEKLQADLTNIITICGKLSNRYQEKIENYASLHEDRLECYRLKKDLIDKILTIANDTNSFGDDINLKIRNICRIYNENQDELEAENDPTSKDLIKALKVLLVGVGFVAGVVPGLIALGVFAKLSHDKTGSINFLSDEASKTSAAMDLKAALRKG